MERIRGGKEQREEVWVRTRHKRGNLQNKTGNKLEVFTQETINIETMAEE